MAGSHHQSCSNMTDADRKGGKEWAMITIRNETHRDIEAREAAARPRVGTVALRRRPPSGCAKAAPRPGCRSSPSTTATSSAPCGSGTSAPGRPAGAAARPARGRRSLARPRDRRRADAPRHRRPRGGSATRRAAGRRRALLRALRLLGARRPARCGCRALTSATACSACELEPGALDGARGLIGATGRAGADARALDALHRRASAATRHPAASTRLDYHPKI